MDGLIKTALRDADDAESHGLTAEAQIFRDRAQELIAQKKVTPEELQG